MSSLVRCLDCSPVCEGHPSWQIKGPLHPDPAQFKQPHVWATFVPTRSSAEVFKTHSTAAVAKSAIRASHGYAAKRGVTMYVYEWDSEMAEWAERAAFPPGSGLDQHPFFQVKHGRKEIPVSDEAVAKAIASITGGGS